MSALRERLCRVCGRSFPVVADDVACGECRVRRSLEVRHARLARECHRLRVATRWRPVTAGRRGE